MQTEGQNPISPFIAFSQFGMAVKIRYRASLENPTLMATYRRDLASEIFAMVCTAAPVKLAWARCAQMAPVGQRGEDPQQPNTNTFSALFDFMMAKWHASRIYEKTGGQKRFRKWSERIKQRPVRATT